MALQNHLKHFCIVAHVSNIRRYDTVVHPSLFMLVLLNCVLMSWIIRCGVCRQALPALRSFFTRMHVEPY
jgi:hypothetical protein